METVRAASPKRLRKRPDLSQSHMAELTEWLKTAIEESGRTLRDLASDIGVSHTALRSWERGWTTPSWENCARIAAALNVDPAFVRELAGYSEPNPQAETDPELAEVIAAWPELDQEKQQALLLTLRGLRMMQRASRRSGQ